MKGNAVKFLSGLWRLLGNIYFTLIILGGIATIYMAAVDEELPFEDGDMSKKSCDDVKNNVLGMKVKNGFGAEFEIIKITGLKQISKTSERINCTGIVTYDNAQVRASRLSMYAEDGYIYYETREIN